MRHIYISNVEVADRFDSPSTEHVCSVDLSCCHALKALSAALKVVIALVCDRQEYKLEPPVGSGELRRVWLRNKARQKKHKRT